MHPLVCDLPGLAELLSVSPVSAGRLARSGSVPGRKVGREWRFWVPAVLAVAAPHARPPDPRPPVGVLLSARTLAGLLGLHPNTARALMRAGRLPAQRVGGVWRAHWPSVQDWLAHGDTGT